MADYQWRVFWYSINETRVRYFDTEADAQEWYSYALEGWGDDATARIERRPIGPWKKYDAKGPISLDTENAHVM